jgi:hypothetical protein
MESPLNWTRIVPLCILLVLPVAAAQAEQAIINCKGQLSEDQLIGLLTTRVDDVYVQAIVKQCGVRFPLTADTEHRLRAAGASDAVIAAVRARAPKPPEKPLSKSDDAAREQKLWDGAKDGKSRERLEDYLRQFSRGQHASEARDKLSKLTRVEELRGEIRLAKEGGQWQGAEVLLKELAALWPEDEEMRTWKNWVSEERARKSDDEAREQKLWESAKDGKIAERLQDYLRQFPKGQYAAEARDKLSKLTKVEELRGKIRQAKDGGQWQEAEARLKELEALMPEDEEMRSLKNWAAEAKRRSELALITWLDPLTRLMWARKDNGSDVNWNQAMSYCRQLRLGGFLDWRLPEIGELEGIYDPSLKTLYKVKGAIELSGWLWSATRGESDSAWNFLFTEGKRYPYLLDLSDFGRALCVRDSRE